MICAGCKTIIGLEEEDHCLGCQVCADVFCDVCSTTLDSWYCKSCCLVVCTKCAGVYYLSEPLGDDDEVDYYHTCPRCVEELILFDLLDVGY